MASWITTKLLGLRKVFAAGVQLYERDAINFVGFSVSDDPINKRTNIALSNNQVAGFFAAQNLEADAFLVNHDAEFDGHVTVQSGAVIESGLSVAGGTASDYYTFTSDIVETRVMATTPTTPTTGTSYWQPSNNGTWTNTTLGGLLIVPLDLPHGVLLQSVSVAIDPSGHAASWPVQTAPFIEIKYLNAANNTVTSLGTHSDDISNQATYEAYHWLTKSTSFAVDRVNHRYWVELTHETGTNATTGTIYVATRVVYTRLAGSRAGQD